MATGPADSGGNRPAGGGAQSSYGHRAGGFWREPAGRRRRTKELWPPSRRILAGTDRPAAAHKGAMATGPADSGGNRPAGGGAQRSHGHWAGGFWREPAGRRRRTKEPWPPGRRILAGTGRPAAAHKAAMATGPADSGAQVGQKA